MTSSTSLYTAGNAANTSGGNYTTLYSGGAGVTVPQRPYGNANVVSLLATGTDGANTVAGIVATGNVTTTANISATGNIYTAGWFVGNIQGDITGNIAAAGSNTELQFNNNNSLGASANLTFNNSTNVLSVTGNIVGSNVIGTVVNGATITSAGNVIGGNITTGGLVTATGNVIGGNIRTAGVVTATGNVIGGNLVTAGLVSAATVSATGNITAANFFGNVTGNIVGNIDAAGSNTQVQFNDTGDILGASADFTFNKTTAALAVTGNIAGGNITTVGTISSTGNITTAGYFLGNVACASGIYASRIFNGNSEVNIGTSGGNANISIGGTSNVAVVTTQGVSVAGNVTAGNIVTNSIVGAGTGNTNLTIDPVGTGDVEILGADAALIVNSGSIQSRQGSGTGNPLTLSANNGSGNGTASIVINDITSGGLQGEIAMFPAGNIFSGQLPYVRIYGGGLVLLPYANNVGNILAANSTMTISSISASGNVTGNYFIGNGSQLTGVVSVIQGNLSGNLQGNGYGANAFTFVSAIGNVTGGNIVTTGLITAAGNITTTSGNITTGGNISATGNVYGGNLIGAPGQNIGIFADGSYNIHLNADLIRVGDLDTEASIMTNGTGNLVLTTNDGGSNKASIKIVSGANSNILLTPDGTGQVITSSLYATSNLTASGIYAIGGSGAIISSTGNVNAVNFNGTFNGDLTGGTVSATGNVTGGNLSTSGTVSATGSISTAGNVTGNYIIGNGSLLTNINAGNVIGAYGNANVSNYLASGTNTANIITSGNVTGNNLTTTGVVSAGNITGISLNVTNEVSAGGNVIGGNVSTGGTVSATGDITTRGALVGNTVQPTFPGVGNSRDLTLNAYGSGNININGPIVTTYAFTTDGNITTNTSNLNATIGGAYTQNGFFGTAGYSQVNVAGNVTGGNIISNALVSGASANISGFVFAGNLRAVATASSGVQASGNIQTTGGFFLGDGGLLSNVASSYGNANVANFLANYGSNTIVTTGNIAAGNINSTNYVAFGTAGAQTTAATGQMFWDTTEQTVSLGMNNGVIQQIGLENYILVKASSAITNGQVVMFTGATGDNVQAAPANMSSAGFRPGYVLGVATQDIALNATGYITTFGQVHDINTNAYTVGDLLYLDPASTTGGFTTTAPTAPNYSIQVATVTKKSGTGHIQVIIRIGDSAAGANTQIQFNDGGAFAGNSTMTFNKTTGNVNVPVLVSAGNIYTGNLFAAPGTGAGNVWIGSTQTPTTVTTTNNPARVIIGNSYTGNADGWSINYDPYGRMRQAVLLVNQRVTRGDGNINFSGMTNVQQMELTANITVPTGTLSRSFAATNFLHVGGGASAYQSAVLSPTAFTGQNSVLLAGTSGNVAVGNVTLAMASGGVFAVAPQNGSTVGNAVGLIGALQPAGATSNITNAIGISSWVLSTSGTAPTTPPTNYNAFYNPSNVSVYGTLTTNNAYRASTNYYAFKNDDAVAQVQLGSLRSYNEFQYSTATSGTVNIDKTNAQVQFINPTANITIGDYQNFVTTANDSVNNDSQTDTVTLIIQQGATPYTVTMPTGNAAIKYLGGTTTVGTTANAVTVVTVKAIRSAANAALYLTSISSEYT